MPQLSQTTPATPRPESRHAPAGNDPLTAFVARIASHPVPLIATDYAIAVSGGFAAVTVRRTFKNAEDHSIEATLTFPVPVHAVLHHLEAQIGDRRLIAIPQGRNQARATYEDALERGKTTVLHEEVLRGVHMLSIGHIAPGTELAVTLRWSMLATHAGGKTQLRIPLTVGDVYGRTNLAESDQLTHAPSDLRGTVSVTCGASRFWLNGVAQDGPVAALPIPLDAPIDIEIDGVETKTVSGWMADGRQVSLRIASAPEGVSPIEAAILIDRSGSMASPASGDGPNVTKHASVLLGLSEAAADLADGDKLTVLEFDNTVRLVGTAHSAKDLRSLIRRVRAPGGGTEIGMALAAAVASGAHDVILVTDGKSHALDIQALSRSGCRFTVVLVGEDSLEANVGHLAALTGGELFAALGADVTSSVAAAINSLRSTSVARPPASVPTGRDFSVLRLGFQLGVTLSEVTANATRTDEDRAVAALVASLMLPGLDVPAATALALEERLVGHLTSLVLVDEAGPTTGDHAANRKVALPTPRTPMPVALSMVAGSRSRALFRAVPDLGGTDAAAERLANAHAPIAGAPVEYVTHYDLAAIARTIDWQSHPQQLIAGDVSVLPPDIALVVTQATGMVALDMAARRHGIAAAALVLGLMARSVGSGNRLAARIAKAILKAVDASVLDDLARHLKLLAP